MLAPLPWLGRRQLDSAFNQMRGHTAWSLWKVPPLTCESREGQAGHLPEPAATCGRRLVAPRALDQLREPPFRGVSTQFPTQFPGFCCEWAPAAEGRGPLYLQFLLLL